MRKLQVFLPEPWEDRTDILFPDSQLLEELADRYVVPSENNPRRFDNGGSIAGQGPTKWVLMKNRQTNVRVIVGFAMLYTTLEGSLDISARFDLEPIAVMVFSGDSYSPLSGTDLRQLPMQSICSAYSEAFGADIIRSNREVLLKAESPSDVRERYRRLVDDAPTEPLPSEYSRNPWFYALVGLQYEAVAERYPDKNTTDKMVEINSPIAKSTVQRWITKARRFNLLAPARLVR